MNIIIEQLGEDITPHVQGLLPLLPQIWQDAHDQSLLRIQVRVVLGGWSDWQSALWRHATELGVLRRRQDQSIWHCMSAECIKTPTRQACAPGSVW
jgi:hypothetical protein